MRTLKLLSLLIIAITFASCSTDDDDSQPLLQIETETVTNLYAPQEGGVDPQTGQQTPISGEFTKFNFATGTTTTSDTDWDIAFRGSKIIVNGGISSGTLDEPERNGNAAAYFVIGELADIITVNPSLLEQDSANGYVLTNWYTYSGPPSHLIEPTPGKMIVVRTHEGKYAKMEILSYYQDNPEEPNAYEDEERYFTFNYVYQPNEGETSFEE